MPFGAECRDDGTVRFRLWAPNAQSVSVRFTGSSEFVLEQVEPSRSEFPMARDAAGWYELVTAAGPGTRYQFVIDGGRAVPDPASRFQPTGVHGPSEIIAPRAYSWSDKEWRGRPWREAVIYELHIGAFSPEGTYAGAERRLDYLADLGVTAIEMMPISSFPGQRNWGYDGVLPYAPTANYGRPDELKHFIDRAHAKNLMVFLDVVYNHFGPEGNYLWLYAPQFFTDRHHTPWGQAVNFDGPESRAVRDYFIHNALYWLEEYHFDGLRLDAVHAIKDDSHPDILTELAETVRKRFANDRVVHLVLENDHNAARYLHREELFRENCGHDNRMQNSCRQSGLYDAHLYDAQWNDDIHHALHILLTGEKDAYYTDYAQSPADHLGRCLTEGFSYQGEPSPYRQGKRRGEPSRHLPPTAFVSFLQNHDQIGNRAFGERICQLAEPGAIEAAMAILLLAPSPVLVFMGEEFAASTPFLFFCDFGPELAAKVSAGRRAEFPKFLTAHSSESEIPDPNSPETFLRSKLDWTSIGKGPARDWLNLYCRLLATRQREIVPLLPKIAVGRSEYEVVDASAVLVSWPLIGGASLHLRTNLGLKQLTLVKPYGRVLFTTHRDTNTILSGAVPPYSTSWFLA